MKHDTIQSLTGRRITPAQASVLMTSKRWESQRPVARCLCRDCCMARAVRKVARERGGAKRG